MLRYQAVLLRLIIGFNMALFSIAVFSETLPVHAAGASYYINCNSGNDANAGTSTAAPWKSATKIGSRTFNPGDTIYIADGCTYTGDFSLSGTGTAALPITVTHYGSGTNPLIQSNEANYNAVQLNNAYEVIENIRVTNAHNSGIGMSGQHDLAQYNEVYNSGSAVEADTGADYSVMTHNNAHDLRMVVDTVGGDDDYGAVGYSVGATNITVSHNICTNCIGQSYDYGYDGGFVEFYGNCDNALVYDNLSNNVDGFTEIGAGDHTDHSNNIEIDNNLMINNSVAVHIDVNNDYGTTANNLHFDNNTFVQTAKPNYDLFYDVNTSTYVRNNIFYLNPSYTIGTTPYVHTNNLYYRAGATTPGYALSTGEKMGDPLFINLAAGNYMLQANSPARGMGASLGYTADYAGHPMNNPPDVGAYQYGSILSTPTPSVIPSQPLVGDINGDGKVNTLDLSSLLSNWGKTTAADDLNHDGVVNVEDLSILLSHWTG